MFSSFGKRSMDMLEENIGEKAEVSFVVRKFPLSLLGRIKDVKRFRFIEIEDISVVRPMDLRLASLVKRKSLNIPFVWPGAAIQKIENEEILYDMYYIGNDFDQTDPKKILELAEMIYGREVADNLVELKQEIKKGDESVFKIFFT